MYIYIYILTLTLPLERVHLKKRIQTSQSRRWILSMTFRNTHTSPYASAPHSVLSVCTSKKNTYEPE